MLGVAEIKNPQLLKALINFDEICNSRKFKFKYLDDWLYTKSTLFKNELNYNKKKFYKFYPRGTIVYVKFGVNVGSEFSGNHFCVVLNKNDNKRSELITVVPLTSKDTKFTIRLEENLVSKAIEKLEHDGLILHDDLTRIKSLHEGFIESDADSKNSKTALEKKLNNIEEDYEQLAKIIKRYERFAGKLTYAIPNQIVTISKNRVTTLNKYDPTGHISFSENTLKVIEDFIRIHILSN